MQWADPDERAMIDRLNAGLFRPIGFELRIEPGDGWCVRMYRLSSGIACLWYPSASDCLFGPLKLEGVRPPAVPYTTSVFSVGIPVRDPVIGTIKGLADFSRFDGCSSLEELDLRLTAEGL